MRHLILWLLVLAAPASLSAQGDMPRIVEHGIDLLRSGDCNAAVTLWTATWPEAQKSQLMGGCEPMMAGGGALKGYDLLRVTKISPHLELIYLILVFKEEPIFIMFVVYKPETPDWIIQAINWNSDPAKVIPVDIIPRLHPE